MMNHKRLFLGLGGMVAAIAVSGAALVSGASFSERSEVMYMTDGPTYAELADLTRASSSVAHVKIVSASKSYYLPFDKASPVVSAPPTDNGGPKDKAREQAPVLPADGTPPPGVLKTDFTVEIVDNVRGDGLKRGQQVVVSQLGGTVATRRPDGVTEDVLVANPEHDELMQVGSEEILFLSQDAGSGKFFTTGGGLGRFKIQPNGTLLAVDHESPLARTQNGKPAASLLTAVQAVK